MKRVTTTTQTPCQSTNHPRLKNSLDIIRLEKNGTFRCNKCAEIFNNGNCSRCNSSYG